MTSTMPGFFDCFLTLLPPMRTPLQALGAPGALLLFCFLCASTSAAHAAPKADFVVAPNGDDAWSGRLAAPNRSRNDGPFATLQKAQQAVRELKQTQPGRRTPITVLVRGGTTYLAAPLVFAPEDSGTAEAPVVYAAYPGEQPVVSGGVRLSGWQMEADGRWQTHLPEVQSGAWSFSQLFVGDRRRYRPRLPKEGYYFIAGDVAPSAAAQGKGYDRFRFRPGDLHADWSNLDDVEILPFHIWTMSRMRIASVDDAAHVVTFTGHTPSLQWYSALPRGNRYLVENVKEALSEPGEWYLDRKSGMLTYIPMPGEDPQKTDVVAPRLENLVQIKGDAARHRWVQYLTFRGLTFAHTNWTNPPEGNSSNQAEAGLSAAFTAEGARHCTLEGCAITHVGAYAVAWGAGCQEDTLQNCELTDLGAGGVKIGEMGIRDDAEAVTGHNTVDNCLIAHGGRLHPAGVGVWIGHSPFNRIEHNEIRDFYYTGVSVGWSWGYGRSLAHDNSIAFNRIHQIGQGVLSDMGGIYTLGLAPGTVLKNNVISDVESYDYGGWGIYPDEGSTGLLIENNVVYHTKSASFHQHYGQDNRVLNNIFALARDAQIMRTRAEDHLSFTMEHNIVYWKQGELLGSNWTGDNYKLDDNLYWNAAGTPITFAGMNLEAWRQKGQDIHSRIADPLFMDPDKGDFRLKPGSPASQIGFTPIDTDLAGRQGTARNRPEAPEPPRAFPPPPPPQPIAEDFEDTPVGEKAPGAVTNEENAQATVRVTDETAASGKHSLKFIDATGQQHEYDPHIYYQPKFDAGVVEGSFDLRMESGALFFHEWRDNANPYHAGPSLTVQPDGTLLARGQRLTQIPHSQWVHFDITCTLSDRATAKYSVTVHLPGRVPAMVFPDLPCDPAFRSIRWYGFVANGTGPGIFYLDNVRLQPR